MQSNPRKARFTRVVLNIAKRVTWLLPRRFEYLGTSYPSSFFDEDHRIERASLFYDPERRLKLKGVNIVLEISSKELAGVEEWHRQRSTNWVDERSISAIYSHEYLSSPRENIVGYVRFDGKSGVQCIDNIECDAKLFHGCLVSLAHLPSGSLYLNFFFWAGPVETSFVQGVSASHLDPTVEFHGYNLLRRSNLVTSHYSRELLAEELIRDGLASLKSEALNNLAALLKRMRISLSHDRYFFKAWEFVNDDSSLRFPSEVNERTVSGETGKEFISVAHKRPDFYGIQGQALYVDMNEFKQEEYDLLCVNSKRFDSFGTDYELDQFRSGGNQIFGSLVVMSLVDTIYAKIKVQLKILESEIGFKNKTSGMSKKQNNLFQIVECLSKTKDELGELRTYKDWVCPKPYLGLFQKRIDALEKIVEKILNRAEREYKFTNDMIGIKVVRSNNRFSWALASFAVVQIALAYLAVDWSKVPDAGASLVSTRGWYLTIYGQIASLVQHIWDWFVQAF
jgi:hypothetical protein